MSHQLISHSDDLSRLQSDGYQISVVDGYLVLRGIPYVNASKQVVYGDLVSQLDLAGEQTDRPSDHTVLFSGDFPCDANGVEIEKIRHPDEEKQIGSDIHVKSKFSSKPQDGYKDYYEKMTTYANILMAEAHAINPKITFHAAEVHEAPDDSPFVYIDNASSRAGITEFSNKVKLLSVAIIGLGGTGSYVLDLVSKTPVKEIHLFDGDIFSQHNAFRSPGAASLEDLNKKIFKVEYLREKYSKMHKRIAAHPEMITKENLEIIKGHDITFLCVDNPTVRYLIIKALEESGSSFIDTGIGVSINDADNSLIGDVRVTTSTPRVRKHVHQGHVPMTEGNDNVEAGDPYAQNIQIADLNSLNACLAVIRWKKLCGFYCDTERDHHNVFTINSNHLLNGCKSDEK